MQNSLRNKHFLVLLTMLICARQNCLAQNWQIVGGGFDHQVDALNVDSLSNNLFISGAFKYADTVLCYGIIGWDGNTYHKFATPINEIGRAHV